MFRRRKSRHESGSIAETVSRWLSKLLRHRGVANGLKFRRDGYTKTADVQHLWTKGSRERTSLSDDLLEKVVRENNKQRFSMITDKKGVSWIRANQGHSGKVAAAIDPEQLLTEVTDPSELPVCVHGTYRKVIGLIEREGLKPMSRQMVHCAPGFPDESGVISGMRASCQVAVYIDVPAAMADGMRFFRSANEVILTAGIDGVVAPKYLMIENLK